MLRNLGLSILIAIGLILLFGWMVDNVWDIHVVSHGVIVEPLEVLVGLSIGAAVMVIIGLIITISVIGAVAFALLVTVAALALAGLTIGWPILLIAIVLWLVFRNNKSDHSVTGN